jgi:hypothetical protein
VFTVAEYRPGFSDIQVMYGGIRRRENAAKIAAIGEELLLEELTPPPASGRRRLEEDPDQSWLLVADRAAEMKKKNPTWEWQWIAQKLNVHPATLRDYRRRKKEMGQR